jgi:hypothetical protein
MELYPATEPTPELRLGPGQVFPDGFSRAGGWRPHKYCVGLVNFSISVRSAHYSR